MERIFTLPVQELLVGLVILACLAVTGRRIIRLFQTKGKRSNGCQCACSGCPLAQQSHCTKNKSEKKSTKRLQIRKKVVPLQRN